MKRLFLLSTLLFSGLAFVSCSSDDDSTSDNGGNGNGDGNTETPVATSITLASDVTTVDLGDTFTFTVMNDLDENVTTTSSFQINEMEATTNNTFTATEAGTYNVTATNGDLTSNTISLTVNDPVTAEPNSVFYNGVNYLIDNTALVFWGGYDPGETGAATHAYWSMVGFSGTVENIETAQNYIEIDFATELDSEGGIVLPNTTANTYIELYAMTLSGTEILSEGGANENNGSISFGSDITLESTTTDFIYASSIDGSAIGLDFDGTLIGVFDNSGRPSATLNTEVSFKQANRQSIKGLLK